MVGRICPPPPGGDRVKVSQNLGATWVAPVAPVDTSLHPILTFLSVGNIKSLVGNTIIGAIFLVYRFKKTSNKYFKKR
jgi:hypothetical protein